MSTNFEWQPFVWARQTGSGSSDHQLNDWSKDNIYHNGDQVVYNHELYVSIDTNGPGPWDSSDWVKVGTGADQIIYEQLYDRYPQVGSWIRPIYKQFLTPPFLGGKFAWYVSSIITTIAGDPTANTNAVALGDTSVVLDDVTNVTVGGYISWGDAYYPVSAVDTATKTVTLRIPTIEGYGAGQQVYCHTYASTESYVALCKITSIDFADTDTGNVTFDVSAYFPFALSLWNALEQYSRGMTVIHQIVGTDSYGVYLNIMPENQATAEGTWDASQWQLVAGGNGGGGGIVQQQSDWTETDTSKVTYIQHKPTIPAAQVQSDWSQTDDTKVDFIANKPTIPAAQVQSDWSQTDDTKVDFIKDKPTIPASPVQSDWDETDDTSLAYIANKPSIPTDPDLTPYVKTISMNGETKHTPDTDQNVDLPLVSSGEWVTPGDKDGTGSDNPYGFTFSKCRFPGDGWATSVNVINYPIITTHAPSASPSAYVFDWVRKISGIGQPTELYYEDSTQTRQTKILYDGTDWADNFTLTIYSGYQIGTDYEMYPTTVYWNKASRTLTFEDPIKVGNHPTSHADLGFQYFTPTDGNSGVVSPDMLDSVDERLSALEGSAGGTVDLSKYMKKVETVLGEQHILTDDGTGQAVDSGYLLSNLVQTSSDQSIGGTKTFTTEPVIPEKTTLPTTPSNTSPATEAQVESIFASSVSGPPDWSTSTIATATFPLTAPSNGTYYFFVDFTAASGYCDFDVEGTHLPIRVWAKDSAYGDGATSTGIHVAKGIQVTSPASGSVNSVKYQFVPDKDTTINFEWPAVADGYVDSGERVDGNIVYMRRFTGSIAAKQPKDTKVVLDINVDHLTATLIRAEGALKYYNETVGHYAWQNIIGEDYTLGYYPSPDNGTTPAGFAYIGWYIDLEGAVGVGGLQLYGSNGLWAVDDGRNLDPTYNFRTDYDLLIFMTGAPV
jgi:hypothetical protein